MKSKWPPCIVTYVDLIGMKHQAADAPLNSARMRTLHRTAQAVIMKMPAHEQLYCWNDSILLVAYCRLTDHLKMRTVLTELCQLIRKLEAIGPHYAITVKGLAFPTPELSPAITSGRCVVLKAASYAMSNCFQIEAAGKRLKRRPSWYIDSRLQGALAGHRLPTFKVKMLPEHSARKVLRADRKSIEAILIDSMAARAASASGARLEAKPDAVFPEWSIGSVAKEPAI